MEMAKLLREAAEWRLLGLLFEYPTESWRSQLRDLLADFPEGDLRAMGEAALETASDGLHIALFGPAGSVPVREVTYLGGVQFGYLMSELAAYYDAFGYRPSIEEPEDHLAVQLGFVSYLKMKEAFALASGDEEHARIAAEAGACFVKEHLAMSAEPVARALENFAPEYLAHAGRIVFERAGPSPRTNYPLGAPLEDDDETGCGPTASGEDLIQLQP